LWVPGALGTADVTPAVLVFASASIIGLLGVAHLVLTYVGPKLLPRDPAVQRAMEQTSPVISRRLTFWSAWIGFNVSHSLGAMLFGLLYGYLAVAHAELLFRSAFLQGVGLLTVGSYALLAHRYWFRGPLIGSTLAGLLFVAGVLWARGA
jgi:hypothetical protein